MSAIQSPKISVLMGIYNCENTLEDAIQSILAQSYSNVELILCDDGSTDRTYEIAQTYATKHPSIILLRNDTNKGLAYALNNCLRYASGNLIARQDGDDFSSAERFQQQVDCFLKHPTIAIVSTATTQFDENGEWGQIFLPRKPKKEDFIKQSPFCHGSSMMTRSSLESVGGYNTEQTTFRSEDYDLWFRMYAAGFLGRNIQQPLYFVREDRNALKRRKYRYRLIEARIRYKGYKLLKLPWASYLYVLRPIVVGIVPKRTYTSFRKRKYMKEVGQ